MFSRKRYILTAGLVVLLAPAAVFSATWNLLGLKDRSVHCLLARDTNLVLAGTSKGISVYSNGSWYDAYSGLPVRALAWNAQGSDVFAAMGNGSKSDGIYLGRNILDGPPFYAFGVAQWYSLPGPLAITTAISGKDTVTLVYTGNGNTVSAARFARDSLSAFSDIPLPDYAFGVEMPVCAALCVLEPTGELFGGGYDASPMAGRGSLVRRVKDSLLFVNRMSVTAMIEGAFTPGPSVMELFIGTKDTGCFRYNPSTSVWTGLGSPEKEPVTSLCALPRAIMDADFPVASVASGVFTYNGFSSGGTWTEMGNIPGSPLCMIVSPFRHGSTQPTVMAGTMAGVYEYAEPTSGAGMVPAAARTFRMDFSRGLIRVRTDGLSRSETALTVYSLDGRPFLRMSLQPGSSSVPFRPTGVFICTCREGANTLGTIAVVNFK